MTTEEKDMLYLNVYYQAPDADAAKGFLKDVRTAEIAEITRRETGCVKYDYYVSADRGNLILLVEQWESPEAQKAHDGQEHMKTLMEIKKKYGLSTEIDRIEI